MAFTINGTDGLTFPDSSTQTTRALSRSGDTMTGSLTLAAANPSLIINKTADIESQLGINNATRNSSIYMYNTYSGATQYVGIYSGGGINPMHLINRDCTAGTNTIPQAIIDFKYDSGWFTTSNSSFYDLTHGLGRRPKFVSVIMTETSGNQNDTAAIWQAASVAVRDGSYTDAPVVGQTIRYDSTKVYLATAYGKQIHPDPRHNYWGGATITTCYYRVYAG